jgi:hypothetical protein
MGGIYVTDAVTSGNTWQEVCDMGFTIESMRSLHDTEVTGDTAYHLAARNGTLSGLVTAYPETKFPDLVAINENLERPLHLANDVDLSSVFSQFADRGDLPGLRQLAAALNEAQQERIGGANMQPHVAKARAISTSHQFKAEQAAIALQKAPLGEHWKKESPRDWVVIDGNRRLEPTGYLLI